MKKYTLPFAALALLAVPVSGQVTVVPETPIAGLSDSAAPMPVPSRAAPVIILRALPPTAIVPAAKERSVVVERERAVNGVVVSRTVETRAMDSTVARQQLSVPPRVIVDSSKGKPPPRAVEVTPPSTTVTETTTTTTVEGDRRSRTRRIYKPDRHIVIVKEDHQSRELPYVTLPVLFVKGTADLFDAQSGATLQQMAGVILEVSATNPNARFEIEGHTSTDGAADMNLTLSAQRAQRVYEELTQRYSVPPATLSAHGYGETFPSYPGGAEDQMQLDRRVLVVRSQ